MPGLAFPWPIGRYASLECGDSTLLWFGSFRSIPATASFRVRRSIISARELNTSGTSDAASRLWVFILPSQSFIPPEHRTQGLPLACDSHLSFRWLSSLSADNTSPAPFPRPTMVPGKLVIHSTNHPSPIAPVFPIYAPDPFVLTITVLYTTRTPNTRPAPVSLPHAPRVRFPLVVRLAVVIVRKQHHARHVPPADDGAGKTGDSFDESSFTNRPSVPNICS